MKANPFKMQDSALQGAKANLKKVQAEEKGNVVKFDGLSGSMTPTQAARPSFATAPAQVGYLNATTPVLGVNAVPPAVFTSGNRISTAPNEFGAETQGLINAEQG